MIYCTYCGREMNDDAFFCTGCGHRLESSQPDSSFSEQTAATFTDTPIANPPADEASQASASFTNTQPMASAFYGTTPAAAPMPYRGVFPEAEPAATPLPYRGVFPEAEPTDEPITEIKEKKEKRRHREKTYTPTFLNTGMGLVLVLVLLCTAVFLCVITPFFFVDVNLINVIKQCALFSVIAVAVVLTARTGGPDLSIGPCIAMSAVIIAQTMLAGGSAISGVLLAASAALVLGLINGFAVVFFRTQALIITLASGLVVSGITTALTQGNIISAQFSGNIDYFASTSIIGILTLLGAALLLGFLYHFFTRAGKPFEEREPKIFPLSYVFAYLASAETAAAAGFVLLVRFQTAAATADLSYTAFVIFVFALLTASRALDNRFAPVLFALVPGIIWGLMSSVFNLWGVYSYYQPIVYSAITLLCLMVAKLSRRQRKLI